MEEATREKRRMEERLAKLRDDLVAVRRVPGGAQGTLVLSDGERWRQRRWLSVSQGSLSLFDRGRCVASSASCSLQSIGPHKPGSETR